MPKGVKGCASGKGTLPRKQEVSESASQSEAERLERRDVHTDHDTKDSAPLKRQHRLGKIRE